WADRIARTVSIDEEAGVLQYLMIDVAVRASSSEDTDAIADGFANHVKWLEGDDGCGCSAYLSGEIIVIESVLDGLFISQVESTALSLVASFLVLMAMTRRLSTSAVIILPVALAGVWVVGTMAVVGLNWNVLTVMITALTIGLGIDYSIHMWRRFEDELEAGANRVEAMATTYSVTGTALMMSAFTTASGFLVLLLSPVPVIQDFGLVSAASVALSLILALFVLPALLLSEAKSRAI
ncbi:MAG: MMPL family transporter, partial [Candidatus Thermoplasmatota archaeon]|nr:MMPL family transporter [Candidatus Thermoplasmatota archaeon]